MGKVTFSYTLINICVNYFDVILTVHRR